jgi:hypothetical protein
MIRAAACGLVLSMPAGFASAQTTYYHCVFPERQAIPNELFLEHDDGKVLVMDPYIHAFVGHPVQGEVVEQTAKRIVFAWTFAATDKRGNSSDLAYRLSLTQGGRAAQISAIPKGYDNTWSASGECEVGTA